LEKMIALQACIRLIRNFNSGGTAVAGRRAVLLIIILTAFSVAMAACAGNAPAPQREIGPTLSLSSSAFNEADEIPARYTCDGQDISPPLAWNEPPTQTQAFALIVDDPDAPGGTFTHWTIFNIPASARQLVENVPAVERLENGALQGNNDFGKIGYEGPCPPHGSVHHYRITIYALDNFLDLKPGASRKQIDDAMTGHVIAQGQLTGTYQH
jgi:Raf kinase inhibitor-like YbhB/YbcL family protein